MPPACLHRLQRDFTTSDIYKNLTFSQVVATFCFFLLLLDEFRLVDAPSLPRCHQHITLPDPNTFCQPLWYIGTIWDVFCYLWNEWHVTSFRLNFIYCGIAILYKFVTNKDESKVIFLLPFWICWDLPVTVAEIGVVCTRERGLYWEGGSWWEVWKGKFWTSKPFGYTHNRVYIGKSSNC